MRFIAVFKQHQMACSLGFDSLVDALDFLFWGYEDHELMPQGVYDLFTDKATVYDHAGQFVGGLSLEAIRTIAKEYLNTFKPLANLIRLSDV